MGVRGEWRDRPQVNPRPAPGQKDSPEREPFAGRKIRRTELVRKEHADGRGKQQPERCRYRVSDKRRYQRPVVFLAQDGTMYQYARLHRSRRQSAAVIASDAVGRGPPALFELLAYVVAQHYGVVVLSVVRAVQQNDVARTRRSRDRCPRVRLFV